MSPVSSEWLLSPTTRSSFVRLRPSSVFLSSFYTPPLRSSFVGACFLSMYSVQRTGAPPRRASLSLSVCVFTSTTYALSWTARAAYQPLSFFSAFISLFFQFRNEVVPFDHALHRSACLSFAPSFDLPLMITMVQLCCLAHPSPPFTPVPCPPLVSQSFLTLGGLYLSNAQFNLSNILPPSF